ncbi:MAG: FkbM family methyltransferase [Saprospiraceae bacterium]|nr:FkbM family methyltransferase [Saprospiraceae bacterium]
MMVNFKIFIVSILTFPFFGFLIRKLYNNKIPFHGITIHSFNPTVSNKTVASLFFQFYESAEVRLVKKYLQNEFPIIELGSSIGAISSVSSLRHKTQPLYAVEANPELIHVLKANLSFNRKNNNFKIYNNAIGYSDNQNLYFQKGDSNVAGKIVFEANQYTTSVPSITLSKIIQENKIDNFILISDIEGMELHLLLQESSALIKCKQLLIELHEASHNSIIYPVEQLQQMIEALNFKLVERDGNVFLFQK